MKNAIVNVFKTLFFFDVAVVIISFLPKLASDATPQAIFKFDVRNFIIIAVLSLFFGLIVERVKIKKLFEARNLPRKVITGFMGGAVIPVVSVLLMFIFGAFDFSGYSKVSGIAYILLALLFNAAASELLLRGYLFKLYKKHYGFIAASIFTTALTLVLHTEFFQYSKLYIFNIILLNLVLCILLDITNSLITTITARFVYTAISTFVLGSLKLTNAYGSIEKGTFKGKAILSGGDCKLEGSIILTILTLVGILLYLHKKYDLIKTAKHIFTVTVATVINGYSFVSSKIKELKK